MSMPSSGNGQWVLSGPGRLEWVQLPAHTKQFGMVGLEMLYCGVCGSDLSMYEGRRSLQYPVSLGHEFVARVTHLDSDDSDQIAVGDIVTGDFNARCGHCAHCVEGKSHLCATGQRTMRFSNRAFARTARVSSGCLTRLERADILPQFVLCEPMSCVLHAIARAEPSHSDRTLVLGCGGLGLAMAIIVCSDASLPRARMWDPLTPRAQAIRNGSNGRVEVGKPEGQYDLVFDLTGCPQGLRDAIKFARNGGRVVSMSHLDGYGDTSFVLPMLTRRDIFFTVSYLNGHAGQIDAAAAVIRAQWHGGWDGAIELHALADLAAVMSGRRRAAACKDIVRCTSTAPSAP